MDVSRRRQAEAAGELRAEVTDDVAKEVAGHNNVKLAGIADDLHGQRINKEMARIDVRVFLADFLENALPEAVSESHGIGLVAHA